MRVDRLEVGFLGTNCYFIIKDNNLIIIDPGDDYPLIKEKIDNLNLKAIFITHNHFDHITALKELLNDYDVPINPEKVDGFNYEIISTPGHTPDSISFYFKEDNMMFTGDFLFEGTIGRTDLDGGCMQTMKNSLIMIRSYPDETIIYPGHGAKTMLVKEKNYFDSYF